MVENFAPSASHHECMHTMSIEREETFLLGCLSLAWTSNIFKNGKQKKRKLETPIMILAHWDRYIYIYLVCACDAWAIMHHKLHAHSLDCYGMTQTFLLPSFFSLGLSTPEVSRFLLSSFPARCDWWPRFLTRTHIFRTTLSFLIPPPPPGSDFFCELGCLHQTKVCKSRPRNSRSVWGRGPKTLCMYI